jgi:two-component system, OmpR family, response regulator
MKHILLIDDDEKLGDLLKTYFQKFAIVCVNASTPSEGIKKLSNDQFELVILDVMLPERDGFEVCRHIRKTSDIPIVMLTARGDVMDRIIGLEIGADDYLSKPFEPRELLARIQTIIKRTKKTIPSSLIQFGDLIINQAMMQATIKGHEIPLTSMEYELLLLFATHPRHLLSRDDILNALKGIEIEIYSRSVDISISRLRQKLKPLDIIKTIRSRGYIFVGEQ